MLIGSLFAGLGGLDVACEWAWPGSRTAWQLDLVGAAVRRRHWPDALQVEADVRTVRGSDLPRVDVLAAGFPCTDLSCAGKQAGLDGEHSGLYREVLRLTGEIRPGFVVIENVPGLLPYMGRLGRDFAALGYGLSWAICEAADAGHPHLRRRVFVLAERGQHGRGPIPVDASGRWSPEDDARTWATAKGSDARSTGASVSTARGADGLACEVRCWPTPGAADSHSVTSHKGGNPSITDAVHVWQTGPNPATMSHGGVSHARTTDTGNARDLQLLRSARAEAALFQRRSGVAVHVLPEEVLRLAVLRARDAEGEPNPGRHWETCQEAQETLVRVMREYGDARDSPRGRRSLEQLTGELADALRRLPHEAPLGNWKDDACALPAMPHLRQEEQGARPLHEALPAVEEVGRSECGEDEPVQSAAHGRRLNPEFVEALMGLPPGWTLPDGPRMEADPRPRAVRGRYPATWDRSVPWPGFDWEPARTLPDGPPCPGRPARIRALGNAVVPQQAALALRALLGEPAQASLFSPVPR